MSNTKPSLEEYHANAEAKVGKKRANMARLKREYAAEEAAVNAIIERDTRFGSQEEFEASYHSSNAQTLRAKKAIVSITKQKRYKKWEKAYEQAYEVFHAILIEWRRKGRPESGVKITGSRLRKITGLSMSYIRERVTLLRGVDLVKGKRRYPAPFAEDGRPLLGVVVGKGRDSNLYIPYLP